MEQNICKNCQKAAKYKCLTCKALYCETHAENCLKNLDSHKLDQNSLLRCLFEDLRHKLQKSLKLIESSYDQIIQAFYSLKKSALTQIEDLTSRLDHYENEIFSDWEDFINKNSVLSKFINNPSNDSKKLILSLVSYTNNLPELSKKISSSFKINFDVQSLQRDTLNKSENSLQNQIKDAQKDAITTFELLKYLRTELAKNSQLGNVIQITKLEQTPQRELVAGINFTFEACFSNKAVELICLTLQMYPNLKTITFEALNPSQVGVIVNTINIPLKIESFNMNRCCDLTSFDFKNLSRKLKDLNLVNFQMNGCQCLSEGINLIVSKLNSKNLVKLNLSGNLLGYEGSRSLSACLNKFNKLTHLYLRNNDLTYREIVILKPALGKLFTLIHLDIAFNDMKAGGITELLREIKKLPLLQYLDISSCKLAEENEEVVKNLYSEEFKGFANLQTLVLDMTLTKRLLDVLRQNLTEFTNIFVSNSAEISPLNKNLR